MGSSFVLPYLKRVITPTVSGVVVLMIGLSLIKVGIIDFGGGFSAMSSGTFGKYEHIGLGLWCSASSSPSTAAEARCCG